MISVAIVTISDSVAAGTRQDGSGPALTEKIQALGWHTVNMVILPDDVQQISNALTALADFDGVDIAITTGGTGIALRDVTPEAVHAIADREIPGLGELMRSEGRKSTQFAPLSRGGGYTRGRTLILCLPGSVRGAVDSLNAVADLAPHIVDLLHGRTEHVSKPAS
ncbi:MAG TPA: MogA/MoaB family molybdenum cofactor biosynthesis protein [Bryobacteraceae bacterium]|nr:MogA/MoaB family molybdenum cofactor biosynthesis protein [Bryobacteraceae bacterium]